MDKPVVPPICVPDYDLTIFESIEELAAKNKSTKEIISVLNLQARSFYVAFANKDSDVYKSFKRGIDQMDISKDDALLQKIAEGNLTAIEIHEKRTDRARFDSVMHRYFG